MKKSSIPAQAKWSKTNLNADGDATLSLDAYPNGATICFAPNPNPSYDEIIEVVVPAQATFSTAVTYKVNQTTAEDTLTGGKIQYKKADGKNTTINVADNFSNLQYQNDTGFETVGTGDSDASDFMGDLDSFRRAGKTVTLRYVDTTKSADNTSAQPVESSTGSGDWKYTFYTGSGSDTDTAGGLLRPSKTSTVKITKAAVGPAYTIDYVNHAITVNKGQSLGTSNASFGEPDWTDENQVLATVAANGKAVKYYFDSAEALRGTLSQFGIRTDATTKAAASLTTFAQIGLPVGFDTVAGSKVSVSGDYVDAAKLTAAQKKAVAATVTIKNDNVVLGYQYALVNADDIGEYFNEGADSAKSGFNYELSVAGRAADAENDITALSPLKWTTVKTNAKGTVAVKLTAGTVAGKYILVRVQENAKSLSSNLMILKAPADANDSWRVIAQEDYTDALDNGSATARINNVKFTSAAVTTSKLPEITFEVKEAKEAQIYIKDDDGANTDKTIKWSVKIGSNKTPVDVEPKITDMENNAGKAVTLELLDEAFEDLPNTILYITVPAVFSDSTGVEIPQQTIAVTVNTQGPVFTYKSATANTITLTVSNDIAIDVNGKSKLLTTDTLLTKAQAQAFITLTQDDDDITPIEVKGAAYKIVGSQRQLIITYAPLGADNNNSIVVTILGTKVKDVFSNVMTGDGVDESGNWVMDIGQNPGYDKNAIPVLGLADDPTKTSVTIESTKKFMVDEENALVAPTALSVLVDGETIEADGNYSVAINPDNQKQIIITFTGDLKDKIAEANDTEGSEVLVNVKISLTAKDVDGKSAQFVFEYVYDGSED